MEYSVCVSVLVLYLFSGTLFLFQFWLSRIVWYFVSISVWYFVLVSYFVYVCYLRLFCSNWYCNGLIDGAV